VNRFRGFGVTLVPQIGVLPVNLAAFDLRIALPKPFYR